MIKKSVVFSLLLLGLGFSSPVFAGNNRIITCQKGSGGCISSTSAPLFEETAFIPGETIQQTLEIKNERDEGCDLHLKIKDKNQSEIDLSQRIFTKISKNNGATVYFGDTTKSLRDLFDKADLGVGGVGVNASEVLLWEMTFDPTVGNNFQGLTTRFDFDLNIECGKGSSGGDSGDDGGDGNSGEGGDGDTVPAALVQGIGGPGGQTQGITTEVSPSPTAESEIGIGENDGEVKGLSTECSNIKIISPFIVLLAHLILAIIWEVFRRKDTYLSKTIVSVLLAGLAVLGFYIIKDCNCYSASIGSLLCRWHWVVSIITLAIVRIFGYSFLEEE